MQTVSCKVPEVQIASQLEEQLEKGGGASAADPENEMNLPLASLDSPGSSFPSQGTFFFCAHAKLSHGTYTSLYTSPSRRPLFPCTGDLRPGAVHSSSKVNAKSRVSCPLIGIRLIILMTVHLRIVKKGGPSNKGSRRSCMSGRRNHKPSPGPPNFRTTLPPYADCDDDDPTPFRLAWSIHRLLQSPSATIPMNHPLRNTTYAYIRLSANPDFLRMLMHPAIPWILDLVFVADRPARFGGKFDLLGEAILWSARENRRRVTERDSGHEMLEVVCKPVRRQKITRRSTFQATWITDHPDTVDWRARLELDSQVTRLSEALKNASPEKGSRNTPFTSQLIYEQLLSVCRSLSLVVPSFLLCGVDLQRPGGLLSSNGSLHLHPYGNTDLGAHLGMRDLQRGYKTNLQSFQAQERHLEAQPAHKHSPPHASERLNDLDGPQARAQPPSTVGKPQVMTVLYLPPPVVSCGSHFPQPLFFAFAFQLGQLLLNSQALAPFCAESSPTRPSPPHPPRENAELNQTLFGRRLAIPTTLSYSPPGGLRLAKEAKCWQVGQWPTNATSRSLHNACNVQAASDQRVW
ncbi:uncharacterized protein CLUP02_05940 [Colletotrichum lupini]|uniref:Uncharacterized protein n=1 Tax=Colletotrichum lupini TaxID=145971 RepID=A0A9Q8SN69_9PEZI|nr:uncharacterized protein CLUP02_05940 [Colletotrichum lupini]UQC80457.1 hypothetical protein CLUP02_05940 [Colletotrichum lupini]